MKTASEIGYITSLIIRAYIGEMGWKTWEAKTLQEQHDIIILIAKDALKAIELIERNERK